MTNDNSPLAARAPLLKGYRTIGFSGLTALCGVLLTIDWGAIVPAQTAGIVLAAVGLLNAIFRYYTNTPITVSVPPVKAVVEVLKENRSVIPDHVIQAVKIAAPGTRL
jgi:hypothetical protein